MKWCVCTEAETTLVARQIAPLLKKGDMLQIQCYKHDGKIHRCWDEAIVLGRLGSVLYFLRIISGIFGEM